LDLLGLLPLGLVWFVGVGELLLHTRYWLPVWSVKVGRHLGGSARRRVVGIVRRVFGSVHVVTAGIVPGMVIGVILPTALDDLVLVCLLGNDIVFVVDRRALLGVHAGFGLHVASIVLR
jgi:hypothetical protein